MCDDHPRPRRTLISYLAGARRRRLECGGAPTRELEHARRELISTITPCSSPPVEGDQCCQQGCPTHSNCAPAPLGSHDIAPLPGGQHLTERRHRPHNKRRLAECAVHRESRQMPPPRRRAGASHRAESEAGPRSQLVKIETDMTHPRISWPVVEVSQYFTRLPTQAPPARQTRLYPQAAEMSLPLPPHTDGAEDMEDADAELELTIADMPVASIQVPLPPPVR